MKNFLAVAVLLMTVLASFGQGVKVQWATTNTGPVVTNIVVTLSSNLQPNRLKATNTLSGAVRIWAATSGTNGFWLDPATITPGAATNVAWPVRGSNTLLTTNGFEVTINALTDTNVVNTLASNIFGGGGSFINSANGTGYNTILTNQIASTNAAGAQPALQVNGETRFYGNVIGEAAVDISAPTFSGGSFSGIGSALTALQAGNISGGTLHPARMATNTPFPGAFLEATSPSTAAWSKDGSTLTNITGNAGGATNLLNAGGEVVIYGNSMEMRDPSTGWTNANWSDQTLSTANTNVLDWFNQRLIGAWLADRLNGDGRGLTNLPITAVNQLSNSLYYLTNYAGAAVSNFTGSFTGNGAGLTNMYLERVKYTNWAGAIVEATNIVTRINVLDYMGVRNSGDVTTDSINAQRAMDASTNSLAGVNLSAHAAAFTEVYFPEGTYYFNRPLFFRRFGQRVRGAGPARTVIYQTANTNLFGWEPVAGSGSPNTNGLYHLYIEDLYAGNTSTLNANRAAFVDLRSSPYPTGFIGGNWQFKNLSLENWYRGFDLRFFNMAKFENIVAYVVNTTYYFDTPQNAVILMGQTFGGRTYDGSFNPAATNLFGATAEPSVGILVTNSGYNGAAMGVTVAGWEMGDGDSALRAYEGMVSILDGNFERMHTNVFEMHSIASGFLANNRIGLMSGGNLRPYFDFYDNTASHTTIIGSVEYGSAAKWHIAVHTNGPGALVQYLGRSVKVTNTVDVMEYYVPFATNRVVVTGPGVTVSQSGPTTTYTVAAGGGGGGPLSGGFTNGSGQITADGHAMELIDPSTGWTNVNWTDQTLSTANTNVLDWFNKRLIGPWTIDAATLSGSTIIVSNSVTGDYTQIGPGGSILVTNTLTSAAASITNGTFYGTLAYPTNLAFAGHTNVFLLSNNYADMVASSDVAVTNVGLAVGGYYKWGTLIVSNSQATNITVRTYSNAVAPLRIQGASSTNALVIGPGKEGFLSYHIRDVKSTNYVTTTQQ